ncbi:MAG TPA: hypothetical protein VE954_41865 [Oligoflexus sp.]|uniref:hypothetical protein n=1 Tax=Oligoflexus sp. TaxID=1971216 RepID=UPI002D64499D|nr:hypothetical protein [Oligoflexus sp.]HYX39690.1 hypothetical protein [Oligoflexus sp.]
MKKIVLFLAIVSTAARAESVQDDLSKKVDGYHQYDATAIKTFTVTKVTAALTAWSKPISLILRCDGKDLEATRKTFTNPQLNSSQTFTITTEVNKETCPSNILEAYFEAPGLEISEVPLSLKVTRGRLLDEGFVRQINDLMSINAEDLVSYSSIMSQHAASEPTMHCIIETYGKRPGLSGIIQELTTNYFNTFGVNFTPGKFTCPPTETLEGRIETCASNPVDRSPFCNTVKLYNMSKSWFVDSYIEAKARKLKLGEEQVALKDKLSDLQTQLKGEVGLSDEIVGIETGFGEDDE